MTETDTAQTSSDPSTERWDEFVRWARQFYEADDFDTTERTYKLEIGERLEDTHEALDAGEGDWIDRLERAFGSPNNLTNWRFHGPFLTWCRAEPEFAATALQALWEACQPTEARFDGFIAAVPGDAFRVPIPEASFLHMALDLRRYHIFRATPAGDAMELTRYSNPHASGRTPAGILPLGID